MSQTGFHPSLVSSALVPQGSRSLALEGGTAYQESNSPSSFALGLSECYGRTLECQASASVTANIFRGEIEAASAAPFPPTGSLTNIFESIGDFVTLAVQGSQPEFVFNVAEGVYLELPINTHKQPLDRHYVLENRHAVERYVARHQLQEIFENSVAQLNASFGDASIKRLDLVTDDEGAEDLLCTVTFPGSADEAVVALEQFKRTWWRTQPRNLAASIVFDVEFV